MLCATHDKTSDAETSRPTRVDADWKAAMGVDDEFTGIAPRTFSLMRSRMVVLDADAKLFEKTLKAAVAKGILKGKLTAIIDSSPVHGAGALCDSYEFIRGFLRQATKAAGDRLGAEVATATEPFCGPTPDIDWQDPVARKAISANCWPPAGRCWPRWAASTTRRWPSRPPWERTTRAVPPPGSSSPPPEACRQCASRLTRPYGALLGLSRLIRHSWTSIVQMTVAHRAPSLSSEEGTWCRLT